MGGMVFTTVQFADTPQLAFEMAVKEAREEYGNQGYTGTISEKDGFRLFSLPPSFIGRIDDPFSINEEDDLIDYLMENAPYQQVFNDKWGPAVCIPLMDYDHTVQKQIGIDEVSNTLPETIEKELVFGVSVKGLQKKLFKTGHEAISFAKRLALNGEMAEVHAYYQITNHSSLIFSASPTMRDEVVKGGMKAYLFTGYASC